MLHIKQAKYLYQFKLWVAFDDGTSGEVDLADCLEGEIFEPLKKEVEFKKVKVDPELETIAWENGADFAPEFIKQLQIDQMKEIIGKYALVNQ